MNNHEALLYRILRGFTLIPSNRLIYRLDSPSLEIISRAEELYLETVSKNRFDFWLTDKQCLQILVKNNLCSADVDANLKAIDERIEDLQVGIYDTLLRKKDQDKIREELKKVREKKFNMIEIRHSLDYLTLKGFGEMVKRQYLSYCTLYDHTTNSRIWNTFEEVDYFVLDRVLEHVVKNMVTVPTMRYIARNEPWRSYWNINKNPFEKPAIELNDEQRTLLLYSKMYDSAYEHPECPPDDVMEDDDMFDGWLIKQKRVREKDKVNKQVQTRFGRHKTKKEAGEMFIPVQSKEEAKKVNSLNTMEGKIIKAQRSNVIKRKGGEVKDTDFLDVKIDLQHQTKEKYKEHLKGKK